MIIQDEMRQGFSIAFAKFGNEVSDDVRATARDVLSGKRSLSFEESRIVHSICLHVAANQEEDLIEEERHLVRSAAILSGVRVFVVPDLHSELGSELIGAD